MNTLTFVVSEAQLPLQYLTIKISYPTEGSRRYYQEESVTYIQVLTTIWLILTIVLGALSIQHEQYAGTYQLHQLSQSKSLP